MPERTSATAAPSRAAVDPAWGHASAAVVTALEQEDLPRLLLDALRTVGPFERACLFVYRGQANPIHVYDSFATPAEKQGLINYTDSTYVLNPFYAAYQRGLQPGVWRMRALAPDGYVKADLVESYQATAAAGEEIGYLTHGWPAGMEELCLALGLPDGECGEISLSRRTVEGGFSDADVAAFEAVLPFVAIKLVVLALIIAAPVIATGLPSLIR